MKFYTRKFNALRRVHQNLLQNNEGPFKIIVKVGKISYKLERPQNFKIHPVFHASVLKPYNEDKEDPRLYLSQRAPISVTSSRDREIQDILSYQAKWKWGQQASTTFLLNYNGQTRRKQQARNMKPYVSFENKFESFYFNSAPR